MCASFPPREHLVSDARLRSSRAFTMLEILVVIAIMGLLAGVLVVGSTRLLDSRNPSPDDVFWKAVQATRQRALLSGTEVRLRFVGNEKERAFVASSKEGEEKFACGPAGELKIEFISTQGEEKSILIMSQKVETNTMPFVSFYGDGTCSPFKLQIRTGGPARTISIDPWTCAQVLPKENDRT